MKIPFDLVQAIARRGDVGAQIWLALTFSHGLEVPKDDEAAMRWYSSAAEAGSELAFCAMAFAYLRGVGVAGAPEQAVEWAKRGALKGFPSLTMLLAQLVEMGYGSTDDKELVRRLLKNIAEGDKSVGTLRALDLAQGIFGPVDMVASKGAIEQATPRGAALATGEMARRLEYGEGVEKDLAQALSMYEKAAELGHPMAALRLYMIYSSGGLGVQPDLEKAAHYWRLANVPLDDFG